MFWAFNFHWLHLTNNLNFFLNTQCEFIQAMFMNIKKSALHYNIRIFVDKQLVTYTAIQLYINLLNETSKHCLYE